MPTLGLCLALAASAAAPVFVPGTQFTLAWTHSIEKVRWEEDYAVLPAPAPGAAPVLQATAARVQGSAAGMEPPPDATLRPDCWYVYQPYTGPLDELRLSRSPYTADYDWCVDGRCEPMRAIMPTDGDVTLLRPCRTSGTPGADTRTAPLHPR